MDLWKAKRTEPMQRIFAKGEAIKNQIKNQIKINSHVYDLVKSSKIMYTPAGLNSW